MARRAQNFVCQNCGAVSGRWQGKCDACGEWNTIVEENAGLERPLPGRSARKGRVFALEPLAGEAKEAPRLSSGLAELDRVTGGGFVRGSVLLVGGDPGNPDTDGDGIRDGDEDADNDGLSDGEEVLAGVDGHLTNPLAADSDGDGADDGAEVALGLDPNNPNDAGGTVVVDVSR